MRLMKSLFIVSLPRSLSTHTFRVARDALGLKAPAWVRNGEILNLDLYALSTWPQLFASSHKFLIRERDPATFSDVTALLDQAVNPEGFIYKDVVNPFVVAEWAGLRNLRVLKIRRDLADVAFAMQRQGWHYPRFAAPLEAPSSFALHRIVDKYIWTTAVRRLLRTMWHGQATAILSQDAMIRGLIRADNVLSMLPGEMVQYDDLITSEEPLRQALRRLYPEAAITAIRYIDAAFREKRKEMKERNDTRRYRSIRNRIDHLHAKMS
jgi:hypothetical protein